MKTTIIEPIFYFETIFQSFPTPDTKPRWLLKKGTDNGHKEPKEFYTLVAALASLLKDDEACVDIKIKCHAHSLLRELQSTGVRK